MNNHSFLPPPVLLSQAFENDRSGGGGITRRSFIKRTGGATVATMIAWNLTVNEARANGESGESGASAYSMKLEGIIPESGDDVDILQSNTTIDGATEDIQIAIEVRSSPPLFFGFPERAVPIDFGYSVIASAAIRRNGVYHQVASREMSFDAHCGLKSTSSPELESSVTESSDNEHVLPQRTDITFEFNNGGNTYALAIDSLDYAGGFNGLGNPEDPGNKTFITAAAKLTGNGLNLKTDDKKVEHTFVSFVVN